MWEDREFSIEENKEEEKNETRKKRVSTESNVRKAKKTKVAIAPPVVGTNIGEGPPLQNTLKNNTPNEPLKPIPKACVSKLEQYLKDIDAFTLEFEGSLAEASAPEFQDYISKKTREKAQGILDTLKRNITDAKTFHTQKVVPKSGLKEIPKILKSYVDGKALATESLDNLAEDLTDAKADIANIAAAGA